MKKERSAGVSGSYVQYGGGIVHCADTGSSHQVLGGIHVQNTSVDGKVYVSATDAKCMAITTCVGHIEPDVPSIIPIDLMPKRTKGSKRPILYYDEHLEAWVSQSGKRFDYPIKGRFPKESDILPDVSDSVVLRIDVDVLAKLAKSIGEEGRLDLLIPVDGDYVSGVVGVFGAGGFGCLRAVSAVGDGDDAAQVTKNRYMKNRDQMIEVQR